MTIVCIVLAVLAVVVAVVAAVHCTLVMEKTVGTFENWAREIDRSANESLARNARMIENNVLNKLNKELNQEENA